MIRRQSSKKGIRVTFVLPEDHNYGRVSVVGDFNGWNPESNRLQRRNNRTFSTVVTLDPGRKFHFRYLTENAGWVDEDSNDQWEPGPFGSHNCVVQT